MAEPLLVPLARLARTIRSKNAGSFFLTFEIIFDNRDCFERVKASAAVTQERIAGLYRIKPEAILNFVVFDPGMGFKATIRRPRVSGSPGESDVYGCQQYAPLLEMMVSWPRDVELPPDDAQE